KMSPSASDAIRSAVENNGLGLIIKFSDDKNVSSFYSRKFSSFQLKQDKKPFILIHSATNDSERYKLKIDEPVCLHYQNDVQPLLQDEQSNVYAANYVYGQGRIVGTTLNNTYTLALTGNNKAWQSLWAMLLDKAAKRIISDETWRAPSGFSFTDQAAPVIVETNNNIIPHAAIESAGINMIQNPKLPYQWQGTYWPRKSGWQTLMGQNGNTKEWFVYDPKNWRELRDYTTIKATEQYIALHPASFFPKAEGENNKLTSDIKLYLVILL